ncbi:MAG TPA: pilus assembly protein TadG-related protein [Myxococcaceae bacterium]|nr:pilus assembly protein TadG-related protein [Myxococcaceae bacterium]
MKRFMIVRNVANQRGATLVLVAVTLTVLLSAMALAIDVGMLLTARAEAQRAADAAALAGAQEFMKNRPNVATPLARRNAYAFAEMNAIQKVAIDSGEVTVLVIPAQRKVRVTIRRNAVPTWFARIFGVNFVPIAAVAAAEASPAGTVKCLKPFAIPDLWNDVNGDSTYTPGVDVYQPHNADFGSCPGGVNDGTGYGSCLRGPERDFGSELTIKVTNPHDTWVPSFFNPIRLGDSKGANDYKNNIRTCNTTPYSVGDTLHVESGDMVGPTYDGMQDLIDQDPLAEWRDGRVQGSKWGDDWMNSPRVAKIALFAPDQIPDPSQKTFVVNNFALIFLEPQDAKKSAVTGRFLYFAQGEEAGTTTSTLVKVLRLVE